MFIFQDVYFPTVIVCNINQNRRSLFRGLGITNESRVDLLYKQFYSGMDRNLTKEEQEFIFNTATSEVIYCFVHPKFRFWFLVTIGDDVTKMRKYYVIFVYIFQGKMEKNRKKITQLK